MSSNSSGYRVRRQLSFQDVPYRGKLFYVDIKISSLKQKITRRICDLGGQVESFLSKDLDLILVDGDEQKKTTDFNKLQNIPLSRGQALLNASTDHKGDGSSNKNDIIHRASLLGVKTQTVKEFVQATAKFISKIKQQKKIHQKENDFLQGMSPITWDKDKENCYILKIEDTAQIYRPLFKQFDNAPKIAYNETGSPFDVGIVLTRQNDGNQSKKKTTKAPTKGGYCESCDHWYKSTLKEHLNSSKHKAFVSSVANFKSLEVISAGLPGLNCFLRKFEPVNKNAGDDAGNLPESESVGENSAYLQHNGPIISFRNDFGETVKNITDTANIKFVPNERIDGSKLKERDSFASANTEDNYSIHNPSIPTHVDNESVHSSTVVKGKTLDAALQDVFSDNLTKSVVPRSEVTLNTRAPVEIDKYIVSDSAHLISDRNQTDNTLHTHSTVPNTHTNASDEPSKYKPTVENNFVPEANFSSSSCSFGDLGVGNVLTFLQSHGSEGGSGKQLSGQQYVDTVTTEKSQNSRESCMVKGSVASVHSVTSNPMLVAPPTMEQFVKSSSEQVCGHVLPMSVENQSTKSVYSEKHINIEQNALLPNSNNCDTSMSDKKVCKRTSHITTNPDYSNITEESVSSEILKVENFKPNQSDLGRQSNCNLTPSKEENEALRNEMMKNVANSGATWSSIRNWLLPGDEADHANQSGQDLDKTLEQDGANKDAETVNIIPKKDCDISNIFNENSAESSNNFVAAWIKNQKFEVAGESENSLHGLSAENVQQSDSNNNNNLKTSAIENIGKVPEEAKISDVMGSIERENKVTMNDLVIGSDAGHTNYVSDDMSDYTSISDCTLENFRIGAQDNIVSERNKESENMCEKSKRDFECMSEKSSISCHMTDKGIKIKGLLSVKQISEKSNTSNKNASQSFIESRKTDACGPVDKLSHTKQDANWNTSSFSQDTNNNCNIAKSVNAPSLQAGVTSSLENELLAGKCLDNINTAKADHTISGAFYPDSDNKKDAQDFQCQQPKTSDFINNFSPKCPVSQVNNQHTYNNMYSPISQSSQCNYVENNGSCMQNDFVQPQSMVPSPLMNDCRYKDHGNIPNYSDKQYIGANVENNIPNPGIMQWDYFNTGILPYETHCMSYGNGYGSFPSEFNQSYASSSYCMNTTDYLAMSSPRHDSTTSQQYTHVSQGNIHGASIQGSNYVTTVQNSQYPVGQTEQSTSVCNSKVVTSKNKGRKTGKRKRNDSQPSFLSSTSSFHRNNLTQLSVCGFSSGIEEPSHSLQSDWYPSSPKSTVSSACLSTIRTEDIAEANCEYSYYKMAVPKKRKIAQPMDCQSYVVDQSHMESALVNSSTPNSQCYMSPHSAMYERMANHQQVNNYQNNSSITYPHLTQGVPFSSPINQVPQPVSHAYPSHLPQQLNQFNTSQSYTANPHSNQPMVNSFDTFSPQINKPIINGVNCNINQDIPPTSGHETQVGQSATSSGYEYNAVQTGETRLKLSKIPFSRPQQQNDLKNYWNVRKAGDCRLVFSTQMGKRKAVEETPYTGKDGFFTEFEKSDNTQEYHHAKKRRCLVY